MTRASSRYPLMTSICSQCYQSLLVRRPFPWLSSSPAHRAITTSTSQASPAPAGSTSLHQSLDTLARHPAFSSPPTGLSRKPVLGYQAPPRPHTLHIFAKRRNIHITLAAANRDAVFSVSSGTLNFKHTQRGSYDASYQLGAFVMAKIKNTGLLSEQYAGKGGPIRALEVCFRDFGPGREALRKILMGPEGAAIRSKITRVKDGSRVKFGGTRSKKIPRK